MMTFSERLAEDRRLVVLLSLNEADGNQANDQVLQKALAYIGHKIGGDQVCADVVWLEQHGLVRIEKLTVTSGELWLVHLTRSGQEVAEGRVHPGVAKPGLK